MISMIISSVIVRAGTDRSIMEMCRLSIYLSMYVSMTVAWGLAISSDMSLLPLRLGLGLVFGLQLG